ncbi:hypothetical protein U14_02483 [Candidatus Moduliflexus flocculans]|uniref:ATP-grasp domain-containing protein n=1 Tax=Candidatus Moduliflexus flocculans TaxID=1499966 RepID=A0A081BLH4_9BACT|nr:hypothetical protein U14_02483 [Candidatus Moduliflexus flocculans]
MIAIQREGIFGTNSPQDYQDKTLLLIGTGGIKRRPVLETLRAFGLRRLIVLHDAPNWAAPYADDWIAAPSAGTGEAALTALSAFLDAHPALRLDGVYTYDEYCVITTARVAEALNLPGVSYQAALRTRDKYAMRDACRAYGLPAPGFLRIRSNDFEQRIAAAGLTYPLVLKPVRGAGSMFVQRVENAQELRMIVSRFQKEIQTQHLGEVWGNDGLQVEEYIAGDEVDIDILLVDGEVRYAQVSDNFAPIEPWFLERGGRLPSLLSAANQQALIDMAAAVLRTLGIQRGGVHFEARLGANGGVPIEANLRIGGAEVCAFHRGAFGVNLLEQAVRIALGLPLTITAAEQLRAYCVSTNFIPAQSGRIRGIHVAPEVRSSPYCEEVVIFREIGDTIKLPPEGFDYCGWMVASGKTPNAASAHLAQLMEGISFQIGA